MSLNNPKPTKNEKREAARQQAHEARVAEKRKQKRRRVLIQIGVLVGIAAVLAGVYGIWSASTAPPGPGPKNMATGGVVFDSRTDLVASKAQPPESEKRAEPKFDANKVGVTVYSDYMCPGCGNFESLYGDLLGELLDNGDIQLNVIPVAFLDSQSAGTKYSSRASNLIGCLAEQQPQHVYAVHSELFKPGVQPAEGTFGLDDQRLLDVAVTAGAEANSELKSCVQKQPFSPFFQSNDLVFSQQGVVGLAPGERLLMPGGSTELQPKDVPQQLASTPTVLVNGVQWKHEEDFALFLEQGIKAHGEQMAKEQG